MPRLRKTKHQRKIPKDKDIILEVGKLRIYFQNSYVIISLINDVLLGGLFFIGSLATLLNAAEWIRQWSYLVGAFLMVMRPVLKILRNIFIYDKDEFQKKVSEPNLLASNSKKEKSNKKYKEDYNYKDCEESKTRNEKIQEIKKQEKENKR